MRRSDPASASDGRRCVLFLADDDYCCGRFCEELFNHLAAESALNWRAASRALRSASGSGWRYPMSPIAVDFLRRCRVHAVWQSEPPLEVTNPDFWASSITIALDSLELKPVVDSAWPQYSESVRYWSGGLLREGLPNDVFELLGEQVHILVQELRDERDIHAA